MCAQTKNKGNYSTEVKKISKNDVLCDKSEISARHAGMQFQQDGSKDHSSCSILEKQESVVIYPSRQNCIHVNIGLQSLNTREKI